jgi:hypothetical protein
MDYLSLADLFLVGVVLDISGALLLAKGLLLSPRTLSALNTNWGVGYGQHEDRCRNRVAGEFGVTYLTGGFVLQAVGYSLNIAGVPTNAGTSRLAGAPAMAGVVTALVWIAWVLLKEPRIKALAATVEREWPAAVQEIEAVESEPRAPGSPNSHGSA